MGLFSDDRLVLCLVFDVFWHGTGTGQEASFDTSARIVDN
jgi:hypothetical protein